MTVLKSPLSSFPPLEKFASNAPLTSTVLLVECSRSLMLMYCSVCSELLTSLLQLCTSFDSVAGGAMSFSALQMCFSRVSSLGDATGDRLKTVATESSGAKAGAYRLLQMKMSGRRRCVGVVHGALMMFTSALERDKGERGKERKKGERRGEEKDVPRRKTWLT